MIVNSLHLNQTIALSSSIRIMFLIFFSFLKRWVMLKTVKNCFIVGSKVPKTFKNRVWNDAPSCLTFTYRGRGIGHLKSWNYTQRDSNFISFCSIGDPRN
ncbi:hypothetical protein SO802_015974 [Lithocarpus litseifolius]|uniref:Uncharacterized protein n=1 Tax=Lithocarpus litseifolius TaxID=425828 RepID=A0AAW2CV67_9ROSI